VVVNPGTKIPYVWDEVTQPKKRLLVTVDGVRDPFEYHFDKLKEWPAIEIDHSIITVEVLADGPTKGDL